MSENKIATRASYGKALLELGQEHQDVFVLDADLANATKTELFRDAFPDRHIECGVAECNMIDVAAGLSTMGIVPFASTFAMFAAGRAYEMIRNTIGYPHLNVKIGATHGGISVGEDGASHQCCEDFALMRSIPGMSVLCPSDDIEARQIVKWAYDYEGPVYMRFSRAASTVFHNEDYVFSYGKAERLQEGNDVCIIATGIMVPEAIEAGRLLAIDHIRARVLNMPTIKPIDEEAIIAAAKECRFIVTVEEHTVIGGLGEAVCSVVCEKHPARVFRMGIQDVFGHSGSASALLDEYGLTARHIVAAVMKGFE